MAYAELPGWQDDTHAEALGVFRRSCEKLLRRDQSGRMAPALAGRVADWQPVCEAAAGVASGDGAARAFFEERFQPYAVTLGEDAEGLFTGYYEPLLDAARRPDGRFRVPLLRRPADLVGVDLEQFAPDLAGRRIGGRVEDGRLVPYHDRAAIDRGALAGRDLELFWTDDPVALFFLQIQGSGQVRLTDGERRRVGYADQNGQPYRAIGRDLVAMGELTRENVSLQSIRAWLHAHPDRSTDLMHRNPSYVFFRDLGPVDGESGPPGAQGVPLTAGRSIAVDRQHVAFGMPLWLATRAPFPDGERPLGRLMVAQDTGGAIRGAIRGDVFWGTGELAEYVAGHMKSAGRWYLLLPKSVTPTS